MLQLRYYPFELEFEYPFTISKGTRSHQPTLITSLGLGNLTGYGEAPAIFYYDVAVAGMIESLEKKRNVIERYALTDPQRFWHFLHHLLPGAPFLIAALDTAGWDLFAQMRRRPLYQILGIPWRNQTTNYTIGLGTAEEMVAKIKEKPWPIYKVKLKNANDIDLLRAIREHTDAPLRVDANEGWTADDTKHIMSDLVTLGVTLIEQPLPKGEMEAMEELKATSPLPFFADESCVGEEDVAKCAKGFHGVNIKLTKCGGITPALRMIAEAKKLGLKLMLGSMSESTVGTTALAHLAPLANELDADGPLLMKEDVAEGLSYKNGIVLPSGAPGLGIGFRNQKQVRSLF